MVDSNQALQQRERHRQLEQASLKTFRDRYPSFPDDFALFEKTIELARIVNEEPESRIDHLDHFVYIVGTQYREHLTNGENGKKLGSYDFWKQEVRNNTPHVYRWPVVTERLMNRYAARGSASGLEDFFAEACRIEDLRLEQPQRSLGPNPMNDMVQVTAGDINVEIKKMEEAAAYAMLVMKEQTRECYEALTMLSVQGKRVKYAEDSVVNSVSHEDARTQAIEVERIGIQEVTMQEVDSYRSFDAPTDGQANGPTYSEALTYLGIHNLYRPRFTGSSLNLELKPFQVVGIAWGKQKLMLNGGAILGDQTGFGKTIQALGIIHAIATDEMMLARDDHKVSMVVVPPSVLDHWVSEAERNFPELDVMVYRARTPTLRSDHAFLNGCKANLKRIIITSYGVLLRHSPDKAKAWAEINNAEPLSCDYSLVNKIGTLIMDEATGVKMTARKLYTTLKSMRADRRLCLTANLCENHLLDASGPISLIDTDRLWDDLKVPQLNPFELPSGDPRTILCGTMKAFEENVEKNEAEAAINMRKLLKEIFRRVTYDTPCHGPHGVRRVGADIAPLRKAFTELEFVEEQEKKYVDMVSDAAKQLFTIERGSNGERFMQLHLDVFRDLHVMDTWASLIYVKKWDTKVTNEHRQNGINLRRFLQLMEKESGFEWNGRWKGKFLDDCLDVELFHGIAAESPIIREIAFLVAHIVLVEYKNVIIWTDFPLTQLLIELSLKATGFPVESYHSGLNERQRTDLIDRFNDGKQEPFAMIMTTKLSTYGMNLQRNCADGIMAGTTFSDMQEDRVLGSIHRLGQKSVTQVFKLMLDKSFMQVRLFRRVEQVIPNMFADTCSSEENTKYVVQIKGDSAGELAENLWKHLEGVNGLPPMPDWFKGVLPGMKKQ
ncbi:helicase of the Snf2 Rad54 family protein [Rutstroemia sp. NJR-2017a WRK4]|nr:helicase of the Snf2 Rad54 family protein [Rutstroemia sp. NJR-2017a WRK4]